MKHKELDLYEVILSAEIDRVEGRILKYRVKQTDHNLIQLQLTDDLEGQGYTHRGLGMSGRMPVTELDKIRRVGFNDTPDHCYRVIFTTQEKLVLAQKRLCIEVAQVIGDRYKRAKELVDAWDSKQPVEFKAQYQAVVHVG